MVESIENVQPNIHRACNKKVAHKYSLN